MTSQNLAELIRRGREYVESLTPAQREEMLSIQSEAHGRSLYPELYYSLAELRWRLQNNATEEEAASMLRAIDRVRRAQALADARQVQDEGVWWRRELRVYRAKRAFLEAIPDAEAHWWISRQTREQLLAAYERIASIVEGRE